MRKRTVMVGFGGGAVLRGSYISGMTTPYVLHYAPDNASLIIRLALEELGLAYTTQLVDRRGEAQHSETYRKLNPAGRIPTLETPQGPISETGAILLWLGDRHGMLVPGSDDPMRGAFLNWLFFISNTLHADAAALFYTHRYGPDVARDDMRDALRARLKAHLTLLEDDAMNRLPGWLGADAPSALDLYVAAILRWLQIYPDTRFAPGLLAGVPKLQAMCARLERRASVAALCKAEGMEPRPFTDAHPPSPPEGSAL